MQVEIAWLGLTTGLVQRGEANFEID